MDLEILAILSKDIIDTIYDMVMFVIKAFVQSPILFVILVFSVFNGIMGLVFTMLGCNEE